MKKAVKKPSTKLIVDQFDKYYRKEEDFRPKKPLQNKKANHYHHFIQQELPQKQAQFYSNYEFQPQKKEELRESLYKKKNREVNDMFHQKIYQIKSEDEEGRFNLNAHSKRESHEKCKQHAIKEKQPIKLCQPVYYNQSRRDYDYFPENLQKKERKQTEKLQKEKRPLSAMNKKYQVHKKVEKSKKQGESIMKKTLSSSKFKQDHRNPNSSLHKQKIELNSQHKKNTQYLKNSVIPHKQFSNQTRQIMHSNNLKKKTVITKPLKIQELHKVYSNHDSSKKLNSSQLISKIKHPKEEQKIQIKPKKELKKQAQEKKEAKFGGNSVFFNNRQHLQRENSQSSQIAEKEIKRNHNKFQQQKRQKSGQERERIFSRRRRPQMTQNEQIRREQAPPQPRNIRQQRRQYEQPRPQPASRNQNPRRENQQRQPRRQGQPRRQHQNRNPRNPRYQSSTSRRQDNPNNILRFVSQTLNGQLEFIKYHQRQLSNQFNMMSNIFENISNFVNINIDAHPNYYFNEYGQYSHSNDSSSDGFNSDTSESYSSEYDYYENQEEPQGLDEQELQMIDKIRYKVSQHGQNQCTICLAQLKNGDQAKKLFCDHLFHSDCIDEWLRRKSDCPVCRDKQG